MTLFVAVGELERDEWLKVYWDPEANVWNQNVLQGSPYNTPERFDERGRRVLIHAFGLKLLEDKLHLGLMDTCSPRKLAQYRRDIEREHPQLCYWQIKNAIDETMADDFPDNPVSYA